MCNHCRCTMLDLLESRLMSVFLYREFREKDPDVFPSGQHWMYLPCTTNANLHNHILNHHLNMYLDEAEKNGWLILVEYVWEAFTNGYTFATLHEVLHGPGVTIHRLPPVAMTNSSGSQPSFPSAPLLTSLEAGLPLFSQAMLHEHLVRFILSDDQVHFSPLVFKLNSTLLTLRVYQCYRKSRFSTFHTIPLSGFVRHRCSPQNEDL